MYRTGYTKGLLQKKIGLFVIIILIQSRAIYAADLMLEKITPSDPEAPPIFRPRLLEINYCPDCVRACKYHPDFFNHMFEVLFMGVTDGIPVHRIV